MPADNKDGCISTLGEKESKECWLLSAFPSNIFIYWELKLFKKIELCGTEFFL